MLFASQELRGHLRSAAKRISEAARNSAIQTRRYAMVTPQKVTPQRLGNKSLHFAIARKQKMIVEYERLARECKDDQRADAAAFFGKRARALRDDKAKLEQELASLSAKEPVPRGGP